MIRVAAAGFALGAAAALAPFAGTAQTYPLLTVTALAQRADRIQVVPHGIFHVTIHVHVTQQRTRLDELQLGTFTDCQIISDERLRTPAPRGSDFFERLTVEAGDAGDATISPAYIIAVDPAVGKPLRYSSDPIRVHIAGSPAAPAGDARATLDAMLRTLIALVALVLIVAGAGVIAAFVVRRPKRPPPVPPIPAAPVPPAAPAPPADARLDAAAAAYRAARSEATLFEVRYLLLESAGVPRGATLVDALRALGERDRALRAALLAAERAAFGRADDRLAAGNEMLAAIEAYRGRPASNEPTWTR